MNDHIFNELCQTYGMAPTKPLRDLVDAVVAHERKGLQQVILEMQQRIFELEQAKPEFSAAEIVRKLGETK